MTLVHSSMYSARSPGQPAARVDRPASDTCSRGGDEEGSDGMRREVEDGLRAGSTYRGLTRSDLI